MPFPDAPDPVRRRTGVLDPRETVSAAGSSTKEERRALRHHSSVDDRAIVDGVRAGDPDAVRALVERDGEVVYRTCYRILGRADEAEDAAQETCLSAYRAIGTYRGEGPVRAWRARIATRSALTRREQRRETAPLEPNAYQVPDRSPEADPAGAALADERRRLLLERVTALPEPYREVVALTYFADLPLSQVAEVTQRPLGTVKTHLHRALERLRRSLAEETVP